MENKETSYEAKLENSARVCKSLDSKFIDLLIVNVFSSSKITLEQLKSILSYVDYTKKNSKKDILIHICNVIGVNIKYSSMMKDEFKMHFNEDSKKIIFEIKTNTVNSRKEMEIILLTMISNLFSNFLNGENKNLSISWDEVEASDDILYSIFYNYVSHLFTINIIASLNPDFISELKNKRPNFKDIEAEDILDIVKPDYSMNEKNYRISTADICKYIGVTLVEKNDLKEREGYISLNNKGKIEIVYRKHTSIYNSRHTVCHELGHLFKHIIIGVEANFIDNKKARNTKSTTITIGKNSLLNSLLTNKVSVNSPIVEQEEQLASKTTIDISNREHIKIELEADKFARELLLPSKVLSILEEHLNGENIDSEELVNHFDIKPSVLKDRVNETNKNFIDFGTDML